MDAPNASYSITLRLLVAAADQHAIGRVTTTIADAGGSVVAVDFVDSSGDPVIVDVTANAAGSDHSAKIQDTIVNLDCVTVHRVSDRTFTDVPTRQTGSGSCCKGDEHIGR